MFVLLVQAVYWRFVSCCMEYAVNVIVVFSIIWQVFFLCMFMWF